VFKKKKKNQTLATAVNSQYTDPEQNPCQHVFIFQFFEVASSMKNIDKQMLQKQLSLKS